MCLLPISPKEHAFVCNQWSVDVEPSPREHLLLQLVEKKATREDHWSWSQLLGDRRRVRLVLQLSNKRHYGWIEDVSVSYRSLDVSLSCRRDNVHKWIETYIHA